MFERRIVSPMAPNANPENIRAKYGKLANTPACAKLKPRTLKIKKIIITIQFVRVENLNGSKFQAITSFINFGAAVIKKYRPHKFP